MLSGIGSVHTRVAPAAAFAYLADPSHAGEWFANVATQELEPGPLRAGLRWRFVAQSGKPDAKPVRMTAYEPTKRFTWETQLAGSRTNIVWELEFAPAPEGGTTLRLTMRWRPGPLGWPMALAATTLMRGVLPQRAQRTVEHARDAVEDAYPAPTPRAPAGRRPKRP